MLITFTLSSELTAAVPATRPKHYYYPNCFAPRTSYHTILTHLYSTPHYTSLHYTPYTLHHTHYTIHTTHYTPYTLHTAGLNNLGNTCFMSASLQCLFRTAPLINYFLTLQYKLDINGRSNLGSKGKLTEEFAKYVFVVFCSVLLGCLFECALIE